MEQANQPKSDLAKSFSGAVQGSYLPALAGLLNGGSLGNSFPGSFGGASTAGQIFNGGGQINPIVSGNPAQTQGGSPSPNTSRPTTQPIPTPGRLPLEDLISQGNLTPEQASMYQDMLSLAKQPRTQQQQAPSQTQQTQQAAYNGNIKTPDSTRPGSGYINFNGQLLRIAGHTGAGTNPDGTPKQPTANDRYFLDDGNGNLIDGPNVDPIDYQNFINQNFGPTTAGGNTQVTGPANGTTLQNGTLRNAQGQQIGSTNLTNIPSGTSYLGGVSGGQQGFNANAQTANPQLGQLGLQGPNAQAFAALMQQLQGPSVSNYNPSASLLNQAASQNYSPLQGVGLAGLAQALQNQIGNIGQNSNLLNQSFNPSQLGNVGSVNAQQIQGLPQLNLGGANLPSLDLGNANLQAAPGREVNAPGAQLNLAQPGNVAAQQFNPTQANIDQSAINPADSQYYQGVQNTLNKQLDAERKDIRARFGAQGGASRGTPAAYAEAQFDAEALPRLAQALGQVRQQEFTNQLSQRQLGQEGNLANAGMANQYGLAGAQYGTNTELANIANQLQAANQGNSALLQSRQQDISNNQQNVQNVLQAAGLNNQSNLQARQQNLDLLGLGQQGALQNQQLVNQAGIANQSNILDLLKSNQQASLAGQQSNQQAQLAARGQDLSNQQETNQLNLQRLIAGGDQGANSLNALSQLFLGNQGQELQNYYNSIGANQNQLGILGQLANQAGNQNFQQNQLGSQNYFNAAGQNSQNANLALQNQLGFQTNNNQAILGQNNLLSQLSQFNAGQGNDLNKQILAQLQAANESQIGRQFTGLQNFSQIAAALAGAGIPGGSANVNLGAQSQTTLQQLAGLANSFGGF